MFLDYIPAKIMSPVLAVRAVLASPTEDLKERLLLLYLPSFRV